MVHHSIVCRLGSDDHARATPAVRRAEVTDVNLLADDGQTLLAGLGQALSHIEELGMRASEVAVDLAIVAATVTAADTRVSRSTESDDHWSRKLHLYVPVSDPTLWESQAPLLRRMLNFLTGDHWSLHFRRRRRGLTRLSPQPEELQTVHPTTVCLFSGGLDSFIGAIDLLDAGEKPLFVSHYWDPNTSKHQGLCSDALREEFGEDRIHQVFARVGFEADLVAEGMKEDTLRARSFMFFALAVLAASAIGGDVTIHVPENGLISLNVPLDGLRVGALSTRTTHPYYMARFNELLQNLGITAQLHNPYRFMTKGQMVGQCRRGSFLTEHAKETMSCSSAGKHRYDADPNRRHPMHCGHCLPCLIRRAAMQTGAGQDDTEYYLADLHADVLDTRKSEGETVRSFQLALARMEADPGRTELEIHKPGPLMDYPDDLGRYRTVYVEGMLEVGRLLAGVRAEPQ